jgi:hypothetical protein
MGQNLHPVAVVTAPDRVTGKMRVRGATVDVAIGIGPLVGTLDVERIARKAARVATIGVRTATVREIAGIPVVMTKDIPEGMHAMVTPRGVTVAWTGTGVEVVTVETSAIAAMTAGAPVERTTAEAAGTTTRRATVTGAGAAPGTTATRIPGTIGGPRATLGIGTKRKTGGRAAATVTTTATATTAAIGTKRP